MCIDCDQPVDGTDGSDVRDCASDLFSSVSPGELLHSLGKIAFPSFNLNSLMD